PLSFPTRRSSDLARGRDQGVHGRGRPVRGAGHSRADRRYGAARAGGLGSPDRGEARGARSRHCGGASVIVDTETRLIAPHGGGLVERTGERPDDLEALETVTLS